MFFLQCYVIVNKDLKTKLSANGMEGSHYDILINYIDTILIDGKIGSTTKKILIYFAMFIFRFKLQCFSFNLWNWSGKQKSDSAQTTLWASFTLKHFKNNFISINYKKCYYYWVNDSLYIQIMVPTMSWEEVRFYTYVIKLKLRENVSKTKRISKLP